MHRCTPTERSECGHEASCLADPCSPLVRADQEGPAIDLDHHEAALDVPVALEITSFQNPWLRLTSPFHENHRMTKSYADRDLPLLL